MEQFLALLRSLWRNLIRRKSMQQSLDEELRAYVGLLAADYEKSGMPAGAARRAALLESGGIENVKDEARDGWAGNAIIIAVRDLHHALRSLRRTPAFFAVAVATLGVGIGGATAVFTVVNAALIRPLSGVADPQELVTVERDQNGRAIAEFSYPDYRDLRDDAATLDGLAAYNGTSMDVEDATGSRRTWVSYVSDDFFSVLGVRPAAGRLFTPAELNARGADSNVVVLAHSLWMSRYAGSLGAIGSTLALDGHPFTIVGVAPEGFVGAMTRYHMEMWIPVATVNGVSPALSGRIDLGSRRTGWLRLVGRLAEDTGIEDARRELSGIAARLEVAYSTNRGRGVQVFAGAGMTAEEREQMIRVPRLLGIAVALMLLIACGNVAGLSLVRAAARRRELATRVALGASQSVLVRQVVVEGLIVATAAAGFGVAIAHFLVRSLPLVQTLISIGDLDLAMDVRVLGVTLAASALTAVLISLVPAMQALRVPAGAVLRDGGRTALGKQRGQRALVAAQVAASLVLLSASAIVFSAFQRVLAAHDDVDPRGLTTVGLDDDGFEDPAGRLSFYEALLEHFAAHPAIEGAAVASSVPPFRWSGTASVFRSGEEPPPEELIGRELEFGLRADFVEASEGFFDLMRIPLLRGRTFTPDDDRRSTPVVILSRRLADELWPSRDPIGRYVSWPAVEGPPRAPLQVVGIVGDTPGMMPSADPPPTMYLPFAQHPDANAVLLLRSRSGTAVGADVVREIVAEVDVDAAVLSSPTLYGRLRGEVLPQRVATTWMGVLGAIALLLAATGLYAVVAQSVLQRTRELAVRTALGASPSEILGGVVGDGMRLAAYGGLSGVVGVLVAFRILRSMFTGVEAADLLPVIAAGGALAAAMLVAAYLPARRIARLDVVDAMRE